MRIPIAEILFAVAILWALVVLVRHLWEVYGFLKVRRDYRARMRRRHGPWAERD